MVNPAGRLVNLGYDAAASPSTLSRMPIQMPALSAAAAAPTVEQPALGTLRGALTLLVICHHALLAYHPYVPPAGPSLSATPFWRAFPVVDSDRWSGAALVTAWNDTFFMALMFLLAGLFAWPSLERKGAWSYLRGRLRRLGIPFVLCSLALAPLAYVPSYLQTGAAWSWSGFWQQWWALETWPTGPAWFLSLLLVFDGLLVLLARAAPALPSSRLANALRRSAVVLGLGLAALALVTYLPFAEHYGALRWTTLGPWTFQTSRVLLYAGFFFLGAVVGARGVAGTALGADGALGRRWGRMGALALVAFGFHLWAVEKVMASMGQSAMDVRMSHLAFALCCAATSLAALAVAQRRGRGSGAIAASLRSNAYGMYLLHYPVVTWLQYAALEVHLPVAAKASLVTACAIALSWLLAAALRALPVRAW